MRSGFTKPLMKSNAFGKEKDVPFFQGVRPILHRDRRALAAAEELADERHLKRLAEDSVVDLAGPVLGGGSR
jgi:hypothetical protein